MRGVLLPVPARCSPNRFFTAATKSILAKTCHSRGMGRDVASAARELLAQYGAGAGEEARRLLEAACDDERNRDAQHWVSVVFFLSRNGGGLSAA
jgi:hypothetical protein